MGKSYQISLKKNQKKILNKLNKFSPSGGDKCRLMLPFDNTPDSIQIIFDES